MAVATVENTIGDLSERVTLRRNAGAITVLAFVAAVVMVGMATGSALFGLGLGGLLLVGSTLVAAEGEPLGTRSAMVMGTVHLVAITLVTL